MILGRNTRVIKSKHQPDILIFGSSILKIVNNDITFLGKMRLYTVVIYRKVRLIKPS